MPPSFSPFLINGPSGDPGLFVPFSFSKRAMIFDLGDMYALSSKDILKISHAFITHTHMDHFAGFDRLLRIILGQDKTLHLYGPEGFLKNIEGKLSGYIWNLVDNYKNRLALDVTEVSDAVLPSRRYPCRNRFQSEGADRVRPVRLPALHEEPSLVVKTAVLDHGVPCLGFSIEEKFKINIRKEALDRLGLAPGPWLHRFKQALFDTHDPEEVFRIAGPASKKEYPLGGLSAQIAIITKGQKTAYIADVAYHASNIEKIVELAEGADRLFIESAFLEKDKAHAKKKCHLTARQAGQIAALAGVKQFTLFHFSPRYAQPDAVFYQEAVEGFAEAAGQKKRNP